MDPASLLLLALGAIVGASSDIEKPSGWSYGLWTPEMLSTVAQLMPGSLVVDLGAGPELVESRFARDQGAARVIAVDKSGYTGPPLERIESWRCTFASCQADLASLVHAARARGQRTVAILSWPSNTHRPQPDLVQILELFDYVVYRGHNFSGTGCGSADLYRYLLRRPVFAAIEGTKNTLILYGPPGQRTTLPLPEELAGYYNAIGGGVIEFSERKGLLEIDFDFL